MGNELLTGWGRTKPSRAAVERPVDAAGVAALFTDPPPRGFIARGLGRSYNDAAQNAGGAVLDATGLNRVVALDADAGTISVEAGASLGDLMALLAPRGWFVPVTPGTRHVTVGGAIAADIHGKNHHRDGSFGDHVRSFVLASPDGERKVSRDSEPELFRATVGGMGLTGIILEATFDLVPIRTTWMSVDTDRTRDLDDTMERMARGDERARYSVAWIDVLARGAALGRGVLTRADHADPGELPPAARDRPLALDLPRGLPAPPWVPGGLLNRATVRAFNEAWYRRAPTRERGKPQALPAFFHPLDGVAGWNRIYGRRGFVQYQFVVPPGEDGTVRAIVERLGRERAPGFLVVLKRLGAGGAGYVSFPTPGWTLAIDLPAATPGVSRLLDDLDLLVVAAGGRVYLAKDGRVRPELFREMYPQADEWRRIRGRHDRAGILRSDLARRLELL
ncbi:MAG: FAD-binding oxidoreductase [Nitriliruptorales bacterium]